METILGESTTNENPKEALDPRGMQRKPNDREMEKEGGGKIGSKIRRRRTDY